MIISDLTTEEKISTIRNVISDLKSILGDMIEEAKNESSESPGEGSPASVNDLWADAYLSVEYITSDTAHL
jgi:hypothetical protein